MARRKKFRIDWKNRFDYQLRLKVIKYYKEGYRLRELCIIFDTDISTILEILRRKKIKKKELCKIYENQDDRLDIEFTIAKEKSKLEKYFPSFKLSEFSDSYYWYWKEKNKKIQEKKENCKHQYRHIRCALCSKILADASNIEISNTIINKKPLQ